MDADFREVSRRPRLPALAGVRIFAALHIYFFHVKQAHDSGLLSFSAISALPAPLASLVGRGHVSTGLFFQLSGFLLAYAYLDSSGRPKTTDWTFWRGRFVRLYPLYFLSLLLLVPAPTALAVHGQALDDCRGRQRGFEQLDADAGLVPRICPVVERAGLGTFGIRGLLCHLPRIQPMDGGPGPTRLDGPGDCPDLAVLGSAGIHASEPRGRWLDRDLDHARRALADGFAVQPAELASPVSGGCRLGRMFGMRVDRGKIKPGRRAGLWPSAGDALA